MSQLFLPQVTSQTRQGRKLVSTRQNRQESVLESQLQTLEVTTGAPGEVQEKVRHREKLEKCATTPSFLFVRTKTQVL